MRKKGQQQIDQGRPTNKKVRPVAESLRLDITAKLVEFRNEDELRELAFPANLSNHDRAVIHDQCKKLGLTSKSRGKGADRYCVVTKKNDLVQGESAGDILHKQIEEADSLKEAIKGFYLKGQSQQKLDDLLEKFPVTNEELKNIQEVHRSGFHTISSKAITTSVKKTDSKLKISESELSNERAENWGEVEVQKRFRELERKRRNNPGIQKQRECLPIASYEKQITTAIRNNQIVLIVGETGCGKSTQVPQMIADSMWQEGKACRVLVAQPRRISAMSVAERIAVERGEWVGESVGYVIRLDKKGKAKSNIVFCTNGVLLRHFAMKDSRKMDADGSLLDGATHIIIDEIHERDRFADFLLIFLKRVLTRNSKLKIILMSATMQIEKFKDYFVGSPVISVPGFTYPVDIQYLEDILKTIKYRAGKNHPYEDNEKDLENINSEEKDVMPEVRDELDALLMDSFLKGSDSSIEELFEFLGSQNALLDCKHSTTGATALMIIASKGRYQECTNLLARGANALLRSNDGSDAVDWAERFGHKDIASFLEEHIALAKKAQRASEQLQSLSLNSYLSSIDTEEVDIDLICEVVRHICNTDTNAKAAILIFLPGWDDIQRTKHRLEANVSANNVSKLLILPLHSQIAPAEQRLVFCPPKAEGQRKVILSTNIAETSVTIEDVVYVIDTGRAKEKNYDPHMGVSTLQCEWISKANAHQRKGRAGRCQRGVCFRLYSRSRHDQGFVENPSPELLRAPLEELCLQAKLLDFQDNEVGCTTLLSEAMESPHPKSIENALQTLEAMDAIQRKSVNGTDTEDLTVLGKHLAKLPLSPRLGKSLILAALMQSLSSMAVIACFTSYRDPWVQPSNTSAQQLASAKKKSFGQAWTRGNSFGFLSDHLAAAGAYMSWQYVNHEYRGNFCYNNFLSSSTLNMIHGMRGQLEEEMKGIFCIAGSQSIIPQIGLGPRIDIPGAGLMRSVLALGAYPQIGELIISGNSNANSMKPSIKTPFFNQKVKVHKSSLAYAVRISETTREQQSVSLVCFDELVRAEAGLFAKSCTIVPFFALLLMAKRVEIVNLEENMAQTLSNNDLIVAVDNYILVLMKKDLFDQVLICRLRFHRAFYKVIQNPKALLQKENGLALYLSISLKVIRDILIHQGDMCVDTQSKDFFENKAVPRSRQGPHAARKPYKFAGNNKGKYSNRRSNGKW